MSRSVSCLNHARHITYFKYPMIQSIRDNEETGEEEEYETGEGEDWEWFSGDLIGALREERPSLEVVKKRWDGNETSIILENDYCEIGVSEYCGLTSLSIRVNEDPLERTDTDEEYKIEETKSEDWIDENWPIIKAAIGYKQLNRVGTFSNGESVYEPVK